MKTNAQGEPFNPQVWSKPIPGSLDYPDDKIVDGELMYSNYDEKVEWERAEKSKIKDLNSKLQEKTHQIEYMISDSENEKTPKIPQINKSNLTQNTSASPWEPF